MPNPKGNPASHYFRPLNPSIEFRTRPDFSRDKWHEECQREADRRFVRELALAFQRGDHLPVGQIKPLRLIG